MPSRPLYLCTGLQSSGSTLVSWCFLQRSDTDGILDADNDLLPEMPLLRAPRAWYKTTLCCFRSAELAAHFGDAGWQVRPLLICRDVRAVWASLSRKRYGVDGTTAEDPPLRLRMRRFKADWEEFRRQGLPILSYDQFVESPERVLRETCSRLELPWDDAMLTWPKPPRDIACTRHGNQTFRESRGNGLLGTLRQPERLPEASQIPPGDLAWLEEEFAEFNRVQGYPAKLSAAPLRGPRSIPRFEVTRRFKWQLQKNPLRRLMLKLSNSSGPLRRAG
jgi:hypothetical protein